MELSCWLVKKNLQPALTAFHISVGKTSKAPAQQVAVPKTKAAKAEAVKDDPASMRRSVSRMLTSLKYKADPTKNKKKEGLEDAHKVLAAAKLHYVLMFSRSFEKSPEI